MQKTREEALELLRKYVKNERMIAHCLASEAVMRALAVRLGKDEELWGQAGLLHDLDVEITAADPYKHGLEAEKILQREGYAPELIDAIKLHNEMATGIKRNSDFHFALACGETITGLLFATALVYPDKSIMSVKASSVVKRMKEKAFAASVSRENIMECERLGLDIADFASLSLDAVKQNRDSIGIQ